MSLEEPRGRALRARQPVNYSLNNMERESLGGLGSNTPTWLKSTSIIQEDTAKENKKPGRKRKNNSTVAAIPKAGSEQVEEVEEAAKSLLAVAPKRPQKYDTEPPKPKKRGRGRPRKTEVAAASRPVVSKKVEKKKKVMKVEKRVVKKKAVQMTPEPQGVQSPTLLQDESSVSEDPTISMQATPEVTFHKNAAKKQKMISKSSTIGGLTRAIVDQFGTTKTSETSVLKDVLEQYNELKTKYQELKSSRMSHVHSMMEEQTKNMMKQKAAGEKLIKHWREEAYKQADLIDRAVKESVKECEEQLIYLSNKKKQLEQQTIELSEQIEQLKEENSQLKASPHSGDSSGEAGSLLLPLLTGLDVLSNSKKKDTYRISHPRTGFSFELDCSNVSGSSTSADPDSSDIGYTPVSFGTLDAKLPEYLKEEIYFDKSQVPILLGKILSTVNS